jgi:hypothetical protein
MKRKWQGPQVSVTFSVPEEVRSKIREIADDEERPQAYVARHLLAWAVYEYERRKERNPSLETRWLPLQRPSVNERHAAKGKTAPPAQSSILEPSARQRPLRPQAMAS